MTVLWRALFLASLVSLPACDIYFGGDDDDDDDDCIFIQTPGYPVEDYLLRDPYTAECVNFGGGSGGGGGYYECDGEERPLPAPGTDQGGPGDPGSASDPAGAQAPPPNWGQCESTCSALDEATCLTTPGCQAAYVDECPADGECGPTSGSFYECWQVGENYGVELPCAQIGDAETCGSRDDCTKIHYPLNGAGNADSFRQPIGNYATCADEPSGSGAGQCYGVPSCDLTAPSCPSGTIAGHDGDCWTGFCIPTADCEPAPTCSAMATEAQCISVNSCTPIYEGNNCSCNGLDCTCSEWDFVRCE